VFAHPCLPTRDNLKGARNAILSYMMLNLYARYCKLHMANCVAHSIGFFIIVDFAQAGLIKQNHNALQFRTGV
jgi:hypothetical protein